MSEARGWHGLGIQQEVSPGRLVAAEAEFERRVTYARKSQTHLWIVTLAHYASDQLLDAFSADSDETPMLDGETLTGRPAVGCYVCEQLWQPLLRHRRCRGEPKTSRRLV